MKSYTSTNGTETNSIREIEENSAHTDPMADQNDIDNMASDAGVEMAPEETLGMKNKLEARDENR